MCSPFAAPEAALAPVARLLEVETDSVVMSTTGPRAVATSSCAMCRAGDEELFLSLSTTFPPSLPPHHLPHLQRDREPPPCVGVGGVRHVINEG